MRKMPEAGDEMRRNLEREIHAAHRRIDFEAQNAVFTSRSRMDA